METIAAVLKGVLADTDEQKMQIIEDFRREFGQPVEVVRSFRTAERNERDIKDVDSITINAVQQRANKYGFALAMSDSPTKYAQIQRAAHVLNEIINSIDQ